MESKDTEQITRNSGVEAQESPDGRDLYFTRADTLGLWKMPAQEGEATLVINDLLHRPGAYRFAGGGVDLVWADRTE